MTPDMPRARELLAFYAEAGVDALLGEEPLDRLSAAQIDRAPGHAREPRAAEAPRVAPAPASHARRARPPHRKSP